MCGCGHVSSCLSRYHGRYRLGSTFVFYLDDAIRYKQHVAYVPMLLVVQSHHVPVSGIAISILVRLVCVPRQGLSK